MFILPEQPLVAEKYIHADINALQKRTHEAAIIITASTINEC